MNKVMFKYLQGYGIHLSCLLITKKSLKKIHWRRGETPLRKTSESELHFTKGKGEIMKTTKGQVGNRFQFISFIADTKEMTDLCPDTDPHASREL